MDDLSDMSLDKFRLWSIHALKVFLSRRKKSVNGNIEELIARAFCVWEEDLPVDEKAEQIELRLLQEYKSKLTVENDVVPDPFSLTSGWKGEKTGMNAWPSLYITDITNYLNCSTPREVVSRLLNEYKEGKAYRYFENEWLKEVFIHDIRSNSDKYIFKSKCTPSQSVNSKCYDVWVVVQKDSEKEPGGRILSGYCTCTAGMHGSCNHIAALLFRIEFGVKTGESKKTCTDVLSEWNNRKGKGSFKPLKASNVTWRKGHYTKNSKDVEDEKQNQILKNKFTPLNKKQNEEVKNQVNMRKTIYDLLKDDIKDSCFALVQEKRRLERPKVVLPLSFKDIAENVRKNSTSETNRKDDFIEKIKLTDEECSDLKEMTVDQSSCEAWIEQRKGRVTASNFKAVSTRVDSLRKKENEDPSKRVEKLMGITNRRPNKAMKHGISMEPHAKKSYVKLMKKKHKNFKAYDSGLSVFLDKPWLAASTDLEVECLCCGKGLCEVKCPESVKDKIPTQENVSYLIELNGQLTLDKKHSYYHQVQGQMKILGRQYCDLFVYTYHGSQLVRVTFESEFWDELEEKLTWFWASYLLPELLEGNDNKENKQLEDNNIVRDADTPTKTMFSPVDPQIENRVKRTLQLSVSEESNKSRVPSTKRRKVQQKLPVYLCGTCGCDCVDEPQSEADQSVNCDICGVWVHYICAGVTDQTLEDVDKWSCSKCK